MSSTQTPLKRKRGNSEDDGISVNNVMSAVPEPERNTSPDIFGDSMEELFSASTLLDDDTQTDKSYMSMAEACEENTDKNLKQESNVDQRCWLGASIEELKGGCGIWGYPQLPPIQPSHNHAVLFQLPVMRGEKPTPLQQPYVDKWDSEHVRMPFSPQNLYAVDKKNKSGNCSSRSTWELVEEALLRQIMSSQQLEAAILSYCGTQSRNWDFTTLHHFLSDVLDESEVDCFFSQLLPNMIQLALQLPSLIKSPIPLLKQFKNSSVSLSQLQIASLLSNAFFCTFPRRNTLLRNSEYATFPDINFNRLFQPKKTKSSQRSVEKLKCILHYFRRVCHKAPEGVVTFTRRYIAPENLPLWGKSSKLLNKLHITTRGTIEDEGRGMLQVDFANKRVGGGVLHWGCVQEEIRFVICPELIISRLFTESMEPLEALHIVGCERFSNYKGYGDTFKWDGDYCDDTPRDSSGRLLCSVTAVDALAFRNPNMQYTPSNITRELNKVYVGFSSPDIPEDQRSPVATGNWGCGVYRGNAKLKSLLQLMAATQAGRHLAYFTFGNEKLRDEIFQMYTFLVDNRVTVGKLYHYLHQYHDLCMKDGKVSTELYAYLYKRISERENATYSSGATHSPGTTQTTKPANSSSRCNLKQNMKSEGQRMSPNLSIFRQAGNTRSKSEKRVQKNDTNASSSLSPNSVKEAELQSVKIVSECSTSHSKQSSDKVTVENLDTVMMEVDNVYKEDSVHQDFSNSSTAKPDTSAKISLLEELQRYDKAEVSKSTTVPKKRISDYFTPVQKEKNNF